MALRIVLRILTLELFHVRRQTMEISLSLTYGENQSIDITVSDEQPYNPDVADDLTRRAVNGLMETWRLVVAELQALA